MMVLVLAFSIPVFAQQVDDKCDSPYQVVYGNGILNNMQISRAAQRPWLRSSEIRLGVFLFIIRSFQTNQMDF
ncbi:hypothetical protein WI95_29295 [Burkholderia contaminans]|nr:hypothetical protein WI95_29295 [Burkholderia contaminans]